MELSQASDYAKKNDGMSVGEMGSPGIGTGGNRGGKKTKCGSSTFGQKALRGLP